MNGKIKIEKIDDYRFRIPREGKMRTDGLVFVSEALLPDLKQDQSLQQGGQCRLAAGNRGFFSGHAGYPLGIWFPIGGVAAFDPDQGVVSPGGVGYDIN